MKRRCKDSVFLKKINLKDFKLTFRSKYRAADIEPKKNSIVQVLYSKFLKVMKKNLDVYEDYPILYKKYYFTILWKKSNDLYTWQKKLHLLFHRRYLNVVKRGYKDCDLNTAYLKVALRT